MLNLGTITLGNMSLSPQERIPWETSSLLTSFSVLKYSRLSGKVPFKVSNFLKLIIKYDFLGIFKKKPHSKICITREFMSKKLRAFF